jgi:selenocysteine lyase/cysteine desulfurase
MLIDHIPDSYPDNVPGADYSVGIKSTARVALGPVTTALLMNAASPSEIIFSNSSTQLAENLARALEQSISPDEHEFIATLEHETNVGPWNRLAQRTKNKIRFWTPTPLPRMGSGQRCENKYAVGYDISSLVPLLSATTRLVAFSACSNILGSFTDIKNVVKTIREVVKEKSGGQGKVEIVVDCVAYAPHRRIDVQDWDVDYAFFSYYKVCSIP